MPRDRFDPERGRDLPGEHHVDPALVDEAVEAINAVYGLTGVDQALALGNLLVDRFFAGDPERARRVGTEHASLVALAQREDLRASPSHLWFCLALIEHLDGMPEDLREGLSFGHHKVLIPVKDLAQRLDLARQAMAEGWSVAALRDAVAEATEENVRGRPRVPTWVKGVRTLGRATAALEERPVDAREIRRLPREEAKRLLETVDRSVSVLLGLKQQLLARSGESG